MAGHSLHVAWLDDTLYCLVQGLGNMQNSFPLKEFVERAYYQKGCRKLILDLSQCRGMDSTFMGTLVGIRKLDIQVVLVNVGKEHKKLLQGLGIHYLLSILETPFCVPSWKLSPLEVSQVSRTDYLETIYQAHQNLIEAEPENAARFRRFVETLLKELNQSREN